MASRYELKKAANRQFHFNLKAGNGEVILSNETYTTKPAAEAGISSVQTNSPVDERYIRKSSAKGEPFFVLNAANGQTIGKSEMYSSESARDNGIVSVKKNGGTADIQDLT